MHLDTYIEFQNNAQYHYDINHFHSNELILPSFSGKTILKITFFINSIVNIVTYKQIA